MGFFVVVVPLKKIKKIRFDILYELSRQFALFSQKMFKIMPTAVVMHALKVFLPDFTNLLKENDQTGYLPSVHS